MRLLSFLLCNCVIRVVLALVDLLVSRQGVECMIDDYAIMPFDTWLFANGWLDWTVIWIVLFVCFFSLHETISCCQIFCLLAIWNIFQCVWISLGIAIFYEKNRLMSGICTNFWNYGALTLVFGMSGLVCSVLYCLAIAL